MSHKPKLPGYSIGKLLGRGAFGEVYLVVNQKTGQKLAGKSISKAQVDSSVTKLIRQEISPLNKLSHSNLVSVYSLLETDSYFCILMDLCEQGSLDSYLKTHGPICEQESRIIAIQLLNAMDYMHSQGIAHRDLKPSNILITKYPNVKISDFGLSGSTSAAGIMSTTCGTIYFSAPECFNPPYNGFSSDVWSLGILIYTMFTGKVPWHEKSLVSLKKEMENGIDIVPGASPEFTDFLKKMIEPKVLQRATPSDLLKHPWILNEHVNEKPKNGMFLNISSKSQSLHSHSSLQIPTQQQYSSTKTHRENLRIRPSDSLDNMMAKTQPPKKAPRRAQLSFL